LLARPVAKYRDFELKQLQVKVLLVDLKKKLLFVYQKQLLN
jgi:hypothetical protein